MARKKGSGQKQADAEPVPKPVIPPELSTLIPDALSRWQWLVVSIVIGTIWIVLLFSLARLFANPVTINRRQIEKADIIVGGEVQDPAAGTFAVEQSWKTTDTPDSVRVTNLQDLQRQKINSGARIILALSKTGGAPDDYEVTSVKRGDGVVSHYVYPLNANAIKQLEATLSDL